MLKVSLHLFLCRSLRSLCFRTTDIEGMKAKISKFIGLLVLAFIFFSCDPAIRYEYYLNNNSDSLLNVKFRLDKDAPFIITNYFPNDSILQVSPKTEILIFETLVPGSNPHDEKYDFLQMFDTLVISRNNQTQIKKNILKREFWTYNSILQHLGTIKTGKNIYSLKLANEDI